MTEFFRATLGPVLFEEKTEYKREVKYGESLRVTIEQVEPAQSGKSFRIRQHLYKESGELSAIVYTVSGWMCLQERKVVTLPEEIRAMG